MKCEPLEQEQGLDVLFGAPGDDANDMQPAPSEADKETSNTPNFYHATANANNAWSHQPTPPAAVPLAGGGLGGDYPPGPPTGAGEGLMNSQGLVGDAHSPGQKEIALSTHPPVVCVHVCVCACVCACVCMLVFVHESPFLFLLSLSLSLCVCVRARARVRACVRACMYIYILYVCTGQVLGP